MKTDKIDDLITLVTRKNHINMKMLGLIYSAPDEHYELANACMQPTASVHEWDSLIALGENFLTALLAEVEHKLQRYNNQYGKNLASIIETALEKARALK